MSAFCSTRSRSFAGDLASPWRPQFASIFFRNRGGSDPMGTYSRATPFVRLSPYRGPSPAQHRLPGNRPHPAGRVHDHPVGQRIGRQTSLSISDSRLDENVSASLKLGCVVEAHWIFEGPPLNGREKRPRYPTAATCPRSAQLRAGVANSILSSPNNFDAIALPLALPVLSERLAWSILVHGACRVGRGGRGFGAAGRCAKQSNQETWIFWSLEPGQPGRPERRTLRHKKLRSRCDGALRLDRWNTRRILLEIEPVVVISSFFRFLSWRRRHSASAQWWGRWRAFLNR